MQLTYIHPVQEPLLSTYQRHAHLAGQSLEVAEIFEWPGRLMARMPGETTWPVPGDSLFNLLPDVFEATDLEIPIRSCGYQRWGVLDLPVYGVVLRGERAVAACIHAGADRQQLDDWPNPGESFQAWKTRAAVMLSAPMAEYFYKYTYQTPFGDPALLSFSTVIQPQELAPSVAVIGFVVDNLFQEGATRRAADRAIAALLAALGLTSDDTPRIVDEDIWYGDGRKRLLNPATGQEGVGSES